MNALLESEIIEGRKYVMSPTNFFHYVACDNLSGVIKKFLGKDYRLVQDVCILPESNTRIYPDIAIFRKPLDITENGSIKGVPVFVAEILSPSTRHKDTGIKLAMYEKYGVKEYWIADPYGKYIEVYKPDGGKFKKVGLYQKFHEEDWSSMTGEEKEEHPQTIKIDFLGAEVNVNEIFEE